MKKVWIGLLALVLTVGLGVPAAMAAGTDDTDSIRQELPVPAAEPQYGQTEFCSETCDGLCDGFCDESCEPVRECSRERQGWAEQGCGDGEKSHCPSEGCQPRNGHRSGDCGRQEGHCGGHHGHHGGHR